MGDQNTPSLNKMMKNVQSGSNSYYRNRNSNSYSLHRSNLESSNTVNENNFHETPKRQKLDDSSNGPHNKSEAESAPGSPWEWRKLKGELISLKTRLNHQEATIEQLHRVRREIEEVFKKEKRVLEIQVEQDKNTIKQLELRIDVGRKTVQEAKVMQSKAERDLIQMKSKMEQKLLQLVADNNKLAEELRKYYDQERKADPSAMSIKKESQDQAAHKSDELEMKLESTNQRIIELEEKLRESREIQQNFEVQSVEMQNLRIKVENLEAEKTMWEEGKRFLKGAAQACELQRELQQAREIISSLRESVKGKLLLEEQMASVEHRLKRTESLERQISQLEVSQADLLAKLSEYENIGISGGPVAVRREINRLRKVEAILTAEEGQLRSQADSTQKELLKCQQMHEETKKMLSDTTNSYERLTRFANRLQKKLSLITRERDSYRQQLDTYEKEITGYLNNETPNLLNERIPALERAIEGYRELVAKLEHDLEIVDGKSQKDELKKLREENDRLKGEIEHRALKGDFNINTRILHFKMNPASIAEKEAEDKQKALMKEVEQLRAIVTSGNCSDVPAASLQAQAKEITELQQKHEIKISRLKEAFKASSHEYRQACYQLFGWRVDRAKEGQYKLSSQYAESPDDYLFFFVNEDGVNMIETPFSATLSTFIERHLKQQRSVPMFLNAVQSDLFDQQTVSSVIS